MVEIRLILILNDSTHFIIHLSFIQSLYGHLYFNFVFVFYHFHKNSITTYYLSPIYSLMFQNLHFIP